MTLPANMISRVIKGNLQGKPMLVWYDNGGTLAEVLRKAVPEDVTLVHFEGSYLNVRATIERNDPQFSHKWLVYVPEAAPEPSWLRDYELFGARLDWTLERLMTEKMGLRSSAVTRQLLAGPRGRALAFHWNQVMPASVTAITYEQIEHALLGIAFHLEHDFTLSRAVLEYVCYPDLYGERLTSLGLHDAFIRAIRDELAFPQLPQVAPVPAESLAAAILLSELVEKLEGQGQEAFSALLPSSRRRWAGIAADWLRRSDLQPEFLRWSKELESKYNIATKLLAIEDDEKLCKVQSFACVDGLLLDKLASLVKSAGLDAQVERANEIVELAQVRLKSPWVEETGAVWRSVAAAARLVQDIRRASAELECLESASLSTFISRYTADDGWWKLDAGYRVLGEASRGLEPHLRGLFVELAVAGYGNWLRKICARFSEAVNQAGRWQAENALPPATLWTRLVVPADQPTAVLTIDALRYDLARQLEELLRSQGYTVQRRTMLAALPSVTEMGMAALLPLAGGKLQWVVKEGKLEVTSEDGTVLTTKGQRLAWAEAQEDGLVHIELDAVNHASRDELWQQIGDARRIVVTSRDIDRAGKILDDVTVDLLDRLVERVAIAVERLHEAGIGRVVIGTDHGFLYLPPNLEPGKIDAPAKSPHLYRHRRSLVGHLDRHPDMLFLSAGDVGLGGTGEVAIPKGLTCLALPGKIGRFLHGGLTPQEAVVAALVSTADVSMAHLEKVEIQVIFPGTITSQVVLVTLAPVGEPTLFHAARKLQLQAREAGVILAVSGAVEVRAAPVRARVVVRRLPAPGLELAVVDVETQEQIACQTVPVELRGYDDLL